MSQPPLLNYGTGPVAGWRSSVSTVLLALCGVGVIIGWGWAGLAFLGRWVVPVDHISWSEFISAWIGGMLMVVAGVVCGFTAGYLRRSPGHVQKMAAWTCAIAVVLGIPFVVALGRIRDARDFLVVALVFLATPAVLLIIAFFNFKLAPFTRTHEGKDT